MQVTLLGHVAAESAHGAVSLGGPKQRAVFALLALNARQVVPMDLLIQELWRDEPPAQATMSLQSYISRLRRVLAAQATDDGRAPTIVTRPPGWVLNISPDDVDVTRFVRLVAEGRDRLAAGQAALAAQRLRTALALWRGPALGDLEDAGFATDEATRLDQLRLDASEVLFEAELAVGNVATVVDGARRFVAASPYRERGWAALMVALYRSGRQADALAAAAELRELLRDQLGVDPSPEIRRLEAQILQQDPALHVSTDAAPSPMLVGADAVRPGPTDRLATPGSSIDEPPGVLVGRADVLAILDEVLAQAAKGRGRAVLVEGSAGIGKSTVLKALDDRVSGHGWLAVHGAGVEGRAGMPALWPWVMVARELVQANPTLLSDSTAAPLALIDPALLGGNAPPPESDPALSRTRLYRAVIDLLASARQEGPVTVVFDDAQWLDSETLSLLAVAVPELAQHGVLFVFGFRSDESTADQDALAMLGRTPRDAVVRLRLPGLDADEVAQVVEAITGVGVDPTVTAAIWTRTAGNPLFVTELVRLLASERRLDPAGVYTVMPSGVRDVLRARLARLPEAAVRVLVVAAFVARSVSLDLLAEVTGLSEDETLDACESAMLAELLVEEPTSGFSLSHDLVRQTLLESLSSARSVRLHAQVGQALMRRQRQEPEWVLEVARHLALAASLIGASTAISHLIEAADYELGAMSFARAEARLRVALELAAQISDREERATCERLVRDRLAMISLYARGPRSQDPARLGSTASPVPVPFDPDEPAGWYTTMIYAITSGSHARAAAEASDVVTAGLPPLSALLVHWVAGLSNFELGRLDVAENELGCADALIEDGLDLATAGILSVAVSVPMLLALIAEFRGDRDASAAQQLRAEARGVRDSDLIPLAFCKAWLSACRGDVSATAAAAETCIQMSREPEYPPYFDAASLLAGWSAALSGDATGPEVADSAFKRYISNGTRLHIPMFLILRAEAHAFVGNRSRARELANEARVAGAETGERSLGPRLTALAETLRGNGP